MNSPLSPLKISKNGSTVKKRIQICSSQTLFFEFAALFPHKLDQKSGKFKITSRRNCFVSGFTKLSSLATFFNDQAINILCAFFVVIERFKIHFFSLQPRLLLTQSDLGICNWKGRKIRLFYRIFSGFAIL